MIYAYIEPLSMLHVHMCAWVNIGIYCVYICIYMCVCICACAFATRHVYVRMCAYTCKYFSLYMHICTLYMFIYIYMSCVYMYICKNFSTFTCIRVLEVKGHMNLGTRGWRQSHEHSREARHPSFSLRFSPVLPSCEFRCPTPLYMKRSVKLTDFFDE